VASNDEAAPKKKSALRENIEVFIVAALLALFIRTFIVQAFKIPSGSMKETLQIGDHILVSKFMYGVKLPFVMTTIIPLADPKRGDIVVFKFPEDPKKDFIKRAVAVGGRHHRDHQQEGVRQWRPPGPSFRRIQGERNYSALQ